MKDSGGNPFPCRAARAAAALALLPLAPFELIGCLWAVRKKKKAPPVNGNFNAMLEKLASGGTPDGRDWAVTKQLATGVCGRMGTSTFDFQTALRVLLTAKEKRENGDADAARWQPPPADEASLKSAFTGYTFFMTQPRGGDMVLWSENLQIQLASAEYLTALLWPDAVFTADGRPAQAHFEHAKQRIKIWLSQRWRYGFAEWNSPTYYVEDISPLCLLIDFAPDEQIRTQAAIVLDLLLFDLAAGQLNGIFAATAGRAYNDGTRLSEPAAGEEPARVYNALGCVVAELAGDPVFGGENPSRFVAGSPNGMLGNFAYRKAGGYQIPEVLKKIAAAGGPAEIRKSTGLTLAELKAKGLIGLQDSQIMMQWAMESFTNPETVGNTLAYCRRHRLFGNANFKYLRFFNIAALRCSGLLPALMKALNPFTHGIALERANTYIYKTPHYLQSTAQAYRPGTHGNQQHVWNVHFGPFAVFASNPLAEPGHKRYWTGSGVLPAAAQYKNITMCVYDTRIKGLKIRKVYAYSHAYFPAAFFDETREDRLGEGMIFGRYGDAFIALRAGGPVAFRAAPGEEAGRHDLICRGAVTCWVCETGSGENESFDGFVSRVSSNTFTFESGVLTYASRGTAYTLDGKGVLTAGGEVVPLGYKRFDSPYIEAERESRAMTFRFGGSSLHLDFDNGIRETCN